MKVTPIKKKFGRYAPGDEFDLPNAAAKLLIKVGKLEAVKETAELSPRTGLPRRQYHRRDMKAEGE